ncbi:magnesium transporter NIPA-domain-containing protein [Polychytrium aggregatum]|uniref:magnesium transporter NIPA-domain-containing protein n=1 Tax=Polychytrium aggregatum TaxID=110093 RepID=UPI0022FE26B1|nr:magnesium transporter NIPA-domain-containing protein [Polychytrium aggregatum]KAI9207625.1 magnesium transporter NIPA-domain-containing protein [Polychytrium aggregatum]
MSTNGTAPGTVDLTKADGSLDTHKLIGIILACSSAFFIGSSFVLKKKGLINSGTLSLKDGSSDHAYLKNWLWWTGMVLLLLGEVCNFAAYAFAPAILVTPLGALSVAISAILASFFLGEKLNFSGKVGCMQCILGSMVVVLNTPEAQPFTVIEFYEKIVDPVFIPYSVINVIVIFVLIFWASPKYGHKFPIVHISICSLIGGFVVVATQALGSAIVVSASGNNQFTQWQVYPLIPFVAGCGVTQINYLNKALNDFSTAVVTPIYYVFFTTSTLICSSILLKQFFTFPNFATGATALIGFLVIVGGVALLFQYSNKLAKEELARSPTTSTYELEGINNGDPRALLQNASPLTDRISPSSIDPDKVKRATSPTAGNLRNRTTDPYISPDRSVHDLSQSTESILPQSDPYHSSAETIPALTIGNPHGEPIAPPKSKIIGFGAGVQSS